MAIIPDLHPIKIPPLEVEFGSQIFTCAGNGLLKDGHGYANDLGLYLPRTEPVRTRWGKIAKRQPTPIKKPLAFWKAQCAFRNLEQTGSIKVLQSRLAGLDPRMDKELAKEQSRANKEFRTSNHIVRESRWLALKTHEGKAAFDLDRFLREMFPKQTPNNSIAKQNAIILKLEERARILQAADPLGLFTELADAPFNADGSRPRPARWIIIGTSRAAVSEKLTEIASLREAAPKPCPGKNVQKFIAIRKWPAYPPNRTPQSFPSSTPTSASNLEERLAEAKAKETWDVTGEWRIRCQAIEEGWPEDCRRGLSMTIFESQIGQKHQLWAHFDFGIASGLVRFMEPQRQVEASESKAKGERTSPVEAMSPVHPSCFKIASLPSPSHPVTPFLLTWRRKWRRRDTAPE